MPSERERGPLIPWAMTATTHVSPTAQILREARERRAAELAAAARKFAEWRRSRPRPSDPLEGVGLTWQSRADREVQAAQASESAWRARLAAPAAPPPAPRRPSPDGGHVSRFGVVI